MSGESLNSRRPPRVSNPNIFPSFRKKNNLRLLGTGLAILCAGILAGILRFRAVEMLPVDYDEPIYLRAAQDYSLALKEGRLKDILNYDYNQEHPPLMKLVYAGVLRFFPETEPIPFKPVSAPPPASLPEPIFTASRRTSAVLGIMQVILVAAVSPLGGVLLAVHTFTIKYTSQVYLEALPAFTSVLSVLAFANFLRLREQSAARKGWCWLVISALALGWTAASKYIYAVVGLAVLFHELWRIGKKGRLSTRAFLPLAVWGGLALMFFFTADPYLWPDPLTRLKASLLYSVDYSQSARVQGLNYPFWQPLVTMFMSVPWHPGVFRVPLDALVTFFALLGVAELWKKQPLYVFWLVTGLFFLLLWPTKWPQYILVITAPLTLSAAEGMKSLGSGIVHRWKRSRSRIKPLRPFQLRVSVHLREAGRDLRKVFPWLLPGTLVLLGIALFPMLFQLAMSLTDFAAPAIRDGLTGGVWREVWLGLTGQVEPAAVDIYSYSRTARSVRYAGPTLLGQIFLGGTADVVAFELVWTFLAVCLQTALGVGTALVLHHPRVRFKAVWRSLFILPWAIPEFVGGIAWAQTFDPKFGWFNQVAQSWFQRPPDIPGVAGFSLAWQDNPVYALLVLLIAATWYGFPLMMLAASAGLKLLPGEVYEAAEMDGANAWQKFHYITRPLLFPLLAPAVLIRMIYAFNQFYLFYALNPPFPVATFATVSFFFFGEVGQYAVSAAINIFTVVVLLFMILAFNRWSAASEGVTYA